MALFYYQALERNGRKTKGMIEADSARHARQLLRGKELIPVHIEARMNTSSGGMLQRRRHAHRRVAAADLALFTRQLATLVQAAMPLETCLQAVSEQSEKLHVKSLGMALRSRIQEGYTLSDSLREHPRVFDSLFCSMVAAGEKSGHLDVVLNRLADYTEQRQRLKSRLLQAMLYPLVLLVVGYLAYVLIDYHRLGDMDLEVDRQVLQPAETGREYHLLSYNIGFGAYEPDYGFFMDGGTESWAWSRERLTDNIGNIGSFLSQQHADFYLIQEVDRDSTRSYHVDEAALLREALPEYDGTWAQNYDSPFLMYPLRHPHGASVSGLMTLSAMTVDSARRVELPIENSLMKLVDLDRCYSVHRIPVAGGGELVLYNLHLSAYTSDGTIAMEQLKLLLEDMQREYDAGNWCVAGGDFNKDLLGDSAVYFGEADQEYTWAQPIPEDTFDGFNVSLIAPLDEGNPVPSCRNADGPYHQGQYVLTVDGFLVSDNVTVTSSDVVDLGFAYSDHNPVEMRFVLEK